MQEFIDVSHTLDFKKTSDISLHNIGYEACPPGYSYGPRVCPYHIIHFVTRGQGTLYINETSLPVHSGEAFLIPADRIASYQASAEDPWSYAWVGFLGTGTDRLVYQLTAQARDRFILRDLDDCIEAALTGEVK